jgi:hypothetical protein
MNEKIFIVQDNLKNKGKKQENIKFWNNCEGTNVLS